jgi:argininosuccinate lyase
MLAVLKGLPLAYNSDLQEDKEATFAARRDLRGALAALAVLLTQVDIDRERLAAAASDPLLLATDATEKLVADGTPFRDAYGEIARAVHAGTFEPISSAAESVKARKAPGPGAVSAAVAAARARLAQR